MNVGPQQNSSSVIIVFQSRPDNQEQEQEQDTALSLCETASIQRSFELATTCYDRTELVMKKLNLHVALIEQENQSLVQFREERNQICRQLLEQAAKSKIDHEQAKITGFETIAAIDQQSAEILQTHIEITNQRIEEENKNASMEKIKIDSQLKEIEILRNTLANIH